MTIGQKIKQLVKEKGTNAEFIANELGVTTSTIYLMYNKDSIETKHLSKICELFSLPVSYFFEENYENSKNTEENSNGHLLNSSKTAQISFRELLEEKERVIQLQQEMINILKKGVEK